MHSTEMSLRQALTEALSQITGLDAAGNEAPVIPAGVLASHIDAALNLPEIPQPVEITHSHKVAYLVREESDHGEELYSWHQDVDHAEERLNNMEDSNDPDFEPVVIKVMRHRYLDVGKKYSIYNA